jgi:hypothetical protein
MQKRRGTVNEAGSFCDGSFIDLLKKILLKKQYREILIEHVLEETGGKSAS